MTGVPTWFTTTDRANIQAILAILKSIQQTERTEMSTLDDLLTEVTKQQGEVASVQTFIQGLQQQLSDALSGISLPPAQQQKVDTIFADLQANDAALAAAITTNPGGATGATGATGTGPTGPTGP